MFFIRYDVIPSDIDSRKVDLTILSRTYTFHCVSFKDCIRMISACVKQIRQRANSSSVLNPTGTTCASDAAILSISSLDGHPK